MRLRSARADAWLRANESGKSARTLNTEYVLTDYVRNRRDSDKVTFAGVLRISKSIFVLAH